MIAWFIEKANAQPGAEGGEVLPFDAIVIILILIVNAVLGYMQEAKAEAAVEALAQMTAPQTSVLRDGKVMRINTADVVPGDIIVLAEGDSVSADGRLVNAASLRIAEASLTGESVPVGKKPDTLTEAKALGDRANMIFNGTSVTQGTGRAIVTGTGMNTQVGKIADMLSATEDEKTPLQKEMDYVSKILGIAVCVIAVVVLVALAVLEGFNDVHDVIDSLLLAVSLAVAAVPEGLAAILTVVLALGVQRMAAHNAIVKKLHSVETLGSASVICSDKTGTLTRNEMTVERVVTPSGEVQITGTGYAPEGRMVMTGGVSPESEQAQIVADEVVATLVAGTLANDGELREENGRWEIVGDPTEVSLIVAARKVKADRKIKRYTRVGEIPFTSERKRMSIIAKDSTDSDKLTVFAKGAPDVLLPLCDRIWIDGQAVPMTEEHRAEIAAHNRDMTGRALRVLAAAMRTYDALPDDTSPAALEQHLCFLGLAGMIDPVRPEVVDAIRDCRSAGIRPIMITGDHVDTASAIARELGLLGPGDEAVTGAELGTMDDDTFRRRLQHISVYARVQPEHKTRIVQAWRDAGFITAMTGDGVNDAPSIRAADIGIGMGITGTDVTKNVADMVLADDNFATIVGAVEEGRRIYDNIQRAIKFLLGSNMSEVLSIFTATMLGFTILEPVHLLWINLLTDCFPALALGMERAEPNVMSRPPRSARESIFAHGVGFDCVYQGVMCAVLTLAAFFIGHYMEYGVWTLTNSPDGTTMAFLTLSMAEIFHSFNMRAHRASIFTLRTPNWTLVGAAAASLALTTLCIYVPFLADAFDFTAISAAEYAVAMGLAVLVIPVVELVKCVQRAVEKRAGRA